MTTSDHKTLGQVEVERVFAACGVTIEAEPAARSPLQRALVHAWQSSEPGWKPGLCKVCAKPFDAGEPRESMGAHLAATVCESCGPIVTAHYTPDAGRGAVPVTLTPWWDEFCPDVYREMITENKYPDTIDRPAMMEVSKWTQSTTTGLYILGPGGTGKTLSLWGKARQLERTGTKPVMLSAIEFARKLALAARDMEKAEWLMQCGVLIIDDLGKEKLSATVASSIWEVIDERNNRRRPTLISSRFTGDQFVARFSDAIMGEDIRGRISDCSTVVKFTGTQSALKRAA